MDQQQPKVVRAAHLPSAHWTPQDRVAKPQDGRGGTPHQASSARAGSQKGSQKNQATFP